MNKTRKILANNIVYFRNKKGWSQERFAELLGTSSSYISEIENEKRNISCDYIDKLADIFKIESHELLTNSLEVKDLDNSIVVHRNYGNIKLDIKTIMNEKGITLNQVVKRTGLHHQVIKRYYNNTIERFDRDVLSKLCFVLDCDLADIIHYEKPKN